MSVASLINRVKYVGNDTADTFSYTFKIFDDDDLKVTVRNPTTLAETVLTKGTHYSITDIGEEAGGDIVLVNGAFAWLTAGKLKLNWVLVIRRVRVLKQETDFRNQGDFYPEVHEDEFDRNVMIDQQLQDEADRSVKLPETYTELDFDPTLPADIIGTNGSTVITNPAGDGFIKGPTANEIAAAQGYAQDAAQSAADAAVSEANAAASESAAAASAALSQQSIRMANQTLGVGDGVTTTFGPINPAPIDEEAVAVLIDGVMQEESLWSLDGSNNIVFSVAPALGQTVAVYYARFGTGIIPLGIFTIDGSLAAPVSVPATPAIIPPATAFHRKFVVSSGGAVTVSANPQIAAGTIIGQILKLVGTSDVNYPIYNDGNGLSLNGAMELKNGSSIELYWNGSVWAEDSRR